MTKARWGALLLLAVVIATVALESTSSAAVVRSFGQGYAGEVFGDFLEVGNGSMRCPDPVDPADPGGAALGSCASAQALRSAAPQDINDSYYMRFADG